MEVPLRVLFDTNIYGFFLERGKQELIEKTANSGKVVVYGLDVIRKELRDTSRKLKHNNRNLRVLLLSGYDAIVQNHSYKLSPVIEALAEEYWKEYKGGISKRKLWIDFLIVACASIHQLNLIVSEDNNSMISTPSVKAYKTVNENNQLPEPIFYSLTEFEKII